MMRMPRIDVSFLIVATLSVVLEAVLGLWSSLLQGGQLAPSDMHITLVGWASLAFYGLTYRAYPELAQSWIAVPHLVVAAASSLLLPLGPAVLSAELSPFVAVVTSFVWLASLVLFLMNLMRIALAGPAAPLERFPSLGSSSSASGPVHGFSQWRESL
jgi:hypothetical protein